MYVQTCKCTNLHESLKLKELAVQILKVLLEKVPEPVIEHDLDQHTESLLLWHLKRKTRKKIDSACPLDGSVDLSLTNILHIIYEKQTSLPHLTSEIFLQL